MRIEKIATNNQYEIINRLYKQKEGGETAMASAILCSTMRWMINTLASATTDGHHGAQEDLSKLQRTLLRIQAVLSDAEEREIREVGVKQWLSELRGLAYDAEDILHEYGYEYFQAKAKAEAEAEAEARSLPLPTSGKRKLEEVNDMKTATSAAIPYQIVVTGSMVRRIKEINTRFYEIAKAREVLSLREDDGKRKQNATVRPPPTTPIDESCVYGREKDKMEIVEMLTSGDDLFSVLPIFGLGGVGKTTLVRLVYNDPVVTKNFKLKVWICVSIDFNVVKLLRAIIQSIKKEPCHLTELSALQSALKKELEERTLLLVLDDVWNEKISLWDSVRVALIGAQRSRVIVTTRNETVAKKMQTVTARRLSGLQENEGRLLFERYAFHGLDTTAHKNLVEIGKKIVKKCNGLPLALRILGSLLCSEENMERWEDILESDVWELREEENSILPVLRLSYDWMPTHLKPCFLYCSLFPKNYLFKKDELVSLWMAQGLIECKGSRRPEDIGRQHFDDLVRRSYFQFQQFDADELPLIQLNFQTSETSCDSFLKSSYFIFAESKENHIFLMHDLILDLARSIAGKEYCAIQNEKVNDDILKEARHLSFIPNDSKDDIVVQSCGKSRAARTLLFVNKMVNTLTGDGLGDEALLPLKMPPEVFMKLRYLRVIDLSYTNIQTLPDSICHLKHLCYLDLKGSKIKSLPESICSLYYLQTLDLNYCTSLQELPKDFSKLFNLRHLKLPMKNFVSALSLPSGIGTLTSLQTLSAFKVGGNDMHCRISELKQLQGIRGHLGISGLQNVTSGKEAREANLINKDHLKTLALDWSSPDHVLQRNLQTSSINDQHDDADKPTLPEFIANGVLESLQPHSGLTQLIVLNYSGTTFSSWMGNPSFDKLASITLFKCHKCEFLPPFGQLPCLKNLLIGSMHRVKHTGTEFSGQSAIAFKALEMLEFESLNEWQKWDDMNNGSFPNLRQLAIRNCSKLQGLPKLTSLLEEQQLQNPEGLKSLRLKGEWTDELWSDILKLKGVQMLGVYWSDNLRILRLDGNLNKLKQLEINQCPNLASTVSLHKLVSLEFLELDSLPEFQFSPGDQLPPTLQILDIESCDSLTSLPLHQHLSDLRDVSLKGCPRLATLEGLQKIELLESLKIIDCHEFSFSSDELLPPALQFFEISNCDKMFSLILHENLSALKELKIEECEQLTAVQGLGNVTSLEHLKISFCPALSFSSHEQLPSSKVDVVIVNCPRLTDWCQRHGIKQRVKDDDSDDEGWDEEEWDWDGDEDENEN
ncbi:putative disease resistance protein RGA3 isoform X1 [Typha latifolia]|uniref:putative disease resistance protein RGA3 isoform X1 n=1 Tax=Typha latifolia TaxID=4733 RepID=UPI003C2D0FDF